MQKGGDNMKKWFQNLAALPLLLAMIIVGGVYKADAADFGHGHRSFADMKIIASLGLTSDEQTALIAALTSNGPAVRTAMQAWHAARKQLYADLQVTPPVGATLVADATALATAKAALQTARAQLDVALSSALTPEHLQQLQADLTAQFQDGLDKKTNRLLFGYAMHLKNQ